MTDETTQIRENDRLITAPFLVVTGTALVFFVYIGMLVPIVPLFIEGPLDGGEFGIGLTLAIFALTAICARPFLGRLADRYGRRLLMVFGALLAGLAGVASGHIEELWQLLLLRGVTGVGEAAVFVGAATLIADLSPRNRRAEGASYFSVAVYGGVGAGPIIGEHMLSDGDYQRAFLVAGCFALLASALALFAPARVDTVDDPDEEIAADAVPERRGLIYPGAILPGLVLASAIAAFAAFSAFIPEYAREVGLATSGGLFALYSVVSLALRIFGAKLPERLGPRRSVTIALSSLLIGLLVLAVVPSVAALWIAAVFVGIGMALNYPSLFALTVNKARDRDRAWAISSFTMFFEIGTAAGGLAIGALAQVVGKQMGFLGGVVFCVIGLYLLRSKLVPVGSPDADPTFVPDVPRVAVSCD